MKKSEIKAGKSYLGKGVTRKARKVLSFQGGDILRYEIIEGLGLGLRCEMTVGAFAVWAKEAIGIKN